MAPVRIRPWAVVLPLTVRPAVPEMVPLKVVGVTAVALTVRVLVPRWIVPEPLSWPMVSADFSCRVPAVSTSTAAVSLMAPPPARISVPELLTTVRPV